MTANSWDVVSSSGTGANPRRQHSEHSPTCGRPRRIHPPSMHPNRTPQATRTTVETFDTSVEVLNSPLGKPVGSVDFVVDSGLTTRWWRAAVADSAKRPGEPWRSPRPLPGSEQSRKRSPQQLPSRKSLPEKDLVPHSLACPRSGRALKMKKNLSFGIFGETALSQPRVGLFPSTWSHVA